MSPKINPLLKSWNEYLSTVYKHVEISSVQHNECQQAFFAGYIDALSHTLDLFDYPSDIARETLRDRIAWLMKYHHSRADALEDGGF